MKHFLQFLIAGVTWTGVALAQENKPLAAVAQLNLASLRLQQTYTESASNSIPHELEELYYNILRMMVLDPDRGDPLENQKSEPAWKVTESVTKDWATLSTQLPVCKGSEESSKNFSTLVEQILDHRRKLQYRAARNIVRSGQLTESYVAYTNDISKCAQPLEEENTLIKTTQRRFRFQKLGLAIDEFFHRYTETYPEDLEIANSIRQDIAQSLSPASSRASDIALPLREKDKLETNSSKSLAAKSLSIASDSRTWMLAMMAINILILFKIGNFLRKISVRPSEPDRKAENIPPEIDHKTKTPEVTNHEEKVSTSDTAEVKNIKLADSKKSGSREKLRAIQVNFRQIVDSEEFYLRLVEEANSLEKSMQQAYVIEVSGYIEKANDILTQSQDQDHALASLKDLLSDIQSSHDSDNYTSLEGLLCTILESEKSREYTAKSA